MYAVELRGISKKFGDILANDNIDLAIKKGEIHCLLGENGAGKTTLMKILFGLYSKDSGSIFINNQEINIDSPRKAIDLGISMIHQHFMLVNRFTVTENIIAGEEPSKGIFIDEKEALKRVEEIAGRYNLRINPTAVIEDISVGEQQRVEIIKALYRKAEILILDEPTAVLTPQETEELFQVMRELKNDGKTIIFITHKLKETMAISDRVTILRNGKKAGTVNTAETDPVQLARMMVGRDVLLQVEKSEREKNNVIFEVKDLSLKNVSSNLSLKNVNFQIEKGEILGLAGVEGNGQLELEEAIMGLRPIEKGTFILNGRDISSFSTREKRNTGMAYIPSDRLKRGLIESFTIEENVMLGSEWKPPFAKRGIIDEDKIKEYTEKIIKEFDIKCSSTKARVSELSGGNQQKLLIGRELLADPEFILASQPTRGVDVGAVEYIHNLLLQLRDRGKGILLISAELDELRSLSDRIMVIYEGRIVAEGRTEDFTEEELGLLMAGQEVEVLQS
ncbi:MAG: ABC transporter ATP-binding protein [Halanaerobiaceae bacterium]|nr:ABC transporter ATP-binding protein [Halanaerobiaceae bacterium]